MPPSDDTSRIDELKKSLYSRDAPEVRTRRKLRFSDSSADLKTGWEEPTEDAATPVMNARYEDHSMSFFTKILIASAIFCVIAVGIGAYVFFNGANLVSGNNIDVLISGPVSIPGGSPVSFNVKVTNKNNVDLNLVDMSVSFPAGATDPRDPTKTLTTYDMLLGDMPAGRATSTDVSAIIFGEENTQKEIVVALTYQIKGSSAIFTKQQTYDVLLNSSPITMLVTSYKTITSGQDFVLTVDLKSNAQDTLKNVILKAQYPFGYTFGSSNLPPLSDKTTWKIGDIPPGGSRSIVVHGKLVGEDTDTRAFHFTVGAQSSTNSAVIGTQYGMVEQDISLEKAFVTMGIAIDSDSGAGEHVGQFNQPEHVTISWFNNLSTAISNVQIVAKLGGSAYDKAKIFPDLGYFDSAQNQIVWNQQTNQNLASVPAGGSGTLSFTLTPVNQSTASSPIVNPTFTIDASVSADRTQEAGASGNLAAATGRVIKVASAISLSGRTLRSIGPFSNTGPIPPKAEQKTTYTIVWTIGNTSNPINDAKVVATLPPYVTWTGNVAPTGEDITYDKNSGTVTWNAGTVTPYPSDPTRRREVAFQISFEPSVSQIDNSPTIVNTATLTGTDSFTGAQLESTQDYMTTSFSTDPIYKSGLGTVVK